MKKILIASYSLDVGGIETALVTLLKNISEKYDITLCLEKKQGLFLIEVPESVKIIEYKASNNKITLIRKISNYIKQQKFKIKYKNKFDFSANYATYSYPCSFVARTASENCALWVHNDYMNFFDNDKIKYKEFFEKLKVREYKKIVFVSENDQNVFVEELPEFKEKTIFCNNLINYNQIINKANEEVQDFDKKEKVITFINLGRHDEKQKKLSRIINATKKLNNEGYKFRVIFVGQGQDTLKYQEQAEGVENIQFLGAKKNPYPYLKNSDCLIMSSDFEGYPVVFIESLILNKPIITTDVSDSKKDIDGKFGLVVEKSEEGLYKGMKEFLDNPIKIQEFNPDNFNQEILNKLKSIIN